MSQAIILVVEDDAGLREALVDTLLLGGYRCQQATNGEEALRVLSRQQVDMVISDIQMAAMDGLTLLSTLRERDIKLPVLLMTAYANINDAVRAIKEGAIDYLAKPFSPEVLLNQVSRYLPAQKLESHATIAVDEKSVQLLQLASKVARSDASVMITGPSGSGKEVMARYIHQHSARAAQPFIAINCAAIPDNMLEATLFGYEKGAFTGAVQGCPGKFEQAQGGTLLLDEITEMALPLQAKLLRVLQEKEVERLGSRKLIALDVRVIATSNRDLKQGISEGVLREDLYYRLNVFPLHWPALCQRKDDILPLAEYLLAQHSKALGLPMAQLTAKAAARLLAHPWPGNVRELDNVVQRALILSDSEFIDESAVILESTDNTFNQVLTPEFTDIAEGLGGELKLQEQQIILETLQNHKGNRTDVAKHLGISPRTLRYKLAQMREAGIRLPA